MSGVNYEKRNDDDELMLDIYIGIGGSSSALRYWLFRAVEGRNERGRYGNIRFFGWGLEDRARLYPFAGRSAAVQVLCGRMKTGRIHAGATGSNDLGRTELVVFYKIQHGLAMK